MFGMARVNPFVLNPSLSNNSARALSFALFVTKIKEALLVEDPREMTERLYNLWWDRINKEENS